MTAKTPEVGDDLESLTDDQLRAVIREYGLNSPWYGDEDERTPEKELLRRLPHLAGFRSAMFMAEQADDDAAVAEHGPRARMELYSMKHPSPAATALREQYNRSVANWVGKSE